MIRTIPGDESSHSMANAAADNMHAPGAWGAPGGQDHGPLDRGDGCQYDSGPPSARPMQ